MAPSSPITSTVKEVTLFKHPLSDETFKTKAAATRAHTAALAAKGRDDEKARTFAANRTLADSVRLRAESIAQVPVLLNEVLTKAMNATIEFTVWKPRFGQQSNSHSAPLGESTNWHSPESRPGWHVSIKGQIKGTKLDLSAVLQGRGSFSSDPHPARGLAFGFMHFGNGTIGNTFNCSLDLWLSDFPLILAKHARFEGLTTERATFRAARVKHDGEVAKLVGTDSTWLGLTARAEEMRTTAAALEGQADERAQSIKDAHPLVQPSAFSPEEVASLQADFGRGY